MSKNLTMFEKIWNKHIVAEPKDQPEILYIDLHLVHEVTSPQAFEGLRLNNRKVRRPDLTIATVDHNITTDDTRTQIIKDEIARKQVETIRENCKSNNITLFDVWDKEQGIVHVIGPEQGYTQPGMTIVCGDSHTSTHGAFGALAFGIGTSEVEHVLATQTLRQRKPKTMKVEFKGSLSKGVTAKDMVLKLIGQIGTAGGTGYVMEYTGEAVKSLNMEGRMTICNMSIEGGARAGMIAPDQTTYDWMKGRNKVPKGSDWEKAIKEWDELRSDPDAIYDSYVEVDCNDLEPFVSWGTNPSQVLPVSAKIPSPDDYDVSIESQSCANALEYMGLKPGTKIEEINVDRVFIGSCTNARLTDLRSAAAIIEGKKVNKNVRAQVMPGSTLTKIQAEKEGIDEIFRSAGFEWRESGCSMCLGMNPDIIAPGERCASTSNRNFEGRQGKGGRTHLVSPEMAAAAAIEGHFVDVRDW
ncbi:MAG: 3-isopropylmalate dehydratase large subunit [Dehalococcoidia bacterium]|jgi:3-isopropylmalate/(R)-2-methylmalate dehydratase large subunit|nr:3-isopropylmalate dehydratase large subunit [Chloroflexota bacterium]MCH2494425.1 3-isopropylmalate dehydratase large subunit [Dehalococcoidia bacterium]MQF83498.1 3-isopropylmalate dehydratase large subunit [SAR202 cluster bacterium]MQG23939.1 3-isopropylmalate dehydratase large subunit [SAR202 cluster bacterium]MQG43910.1 3-isopropylmalate dehydratase large subunit [SAR202 cluster bacterium]|tara:strand:+ start:5076 stop:6482 length:1407 start_codon:yes stop_codon:yes gene_type:complete